MSSVLQFGILGLSTGALYVLIAIGIIVVYRGSGVVNFASGAMAMAGGYAFFELRITHHVALGLALVLAILIATALGIAVHVLIMRRLAGASILMRAIASVGVLGALQSGAALRYPQEVTVVPGFLPQGTVSIFGAVLGEDRLIILGISLAIALGLWLVYRYTSLGRATTAVAESRRSAAALGISPELVGTLNWGIAGTLAGIAAVLIAPITGLGVTQLTLLVIPALAAAVVGKMVSFPLTVVGGLGIGVAQSEITRYVTLPGWDSAVPFILVAIVLLARRGRITSRGEPTARLPSVGTGRLRPGLIVGVGALVLILLWVVLPATWVNSVTLQAIFALIVLSQLFVTGYAGQLSLCQVAFAGIGAVVAGNLVANAHAPFWLAILVGDLAPVPIACLIGLAGVRTRGVYLAILTLGFAVAVEALVFENQTYTGGLSGITVGPQHLFGIDVDAINFPKRYATLAILAFVLVGVAIANVRRGRSGRRLLAVRVNERAAASLGISVTGAKIYGFVVSGMVAALGGILLGFINPQIVYTQFGPLESIANLQQAVVGGLGWIGGGPLGAGLHPGTIGTRVLDFFGVGLDKYLFLAGSLLTIVMVLLMPDGFAAPHAQVFMATGRAAGRGVHQALNRILHRGRRPGASASGRSDIEALLTVPARLIRAVAPRTLSVRSLTIQYGGVRAVDEVTLQVGPGQIMALIGPNGAGKTTMLDAITGFAVPASGQICLDDVELNRIPQYRRARMGIGRSFQSLELFDDMTVLENIQAASESRDFRVYLTDIVRPGRGELSPAAVTAIEEFRLEPYLQQRPTELTYAQRRLVAIARAVAAEPSVLLLDEPAAGLGRGERAELVNLVGRLARERGMAVLIIEHDVELVLRLADRVYVLDSGRCIAEGDPATVRRDPKVIAAYLGATSEPGDPVGASV